MNWHGVAIQCSSSLQVVLTENEAEKNFKKNAQPLQHDSKTCVLLSRTKQNKNQKTNKTF